MDQRRPDAGGLLIGFAAGERMHVIPGYEPESGDAPVWAGVVASGLVALVVLAPCAAADYFGRRALKDGVRRCLVPAVIGAVVAFGRKGLTIVS